MVEWMLSHIIEMEFEKAVGKNHHEDGKAMHIGFDLHCENKTDQYRVAHMYLFAPGNYVYVALQEERIDAKGKRHVGKMEMLCYHDSCWRDSIQSYIFKHSAEMGTFSAFDKFKSWYDVLTLSQEEIDYLRKLEKWRYDAAIRSDPAQYPAANPFDERGIWAKRK